MNKSHMRTASSTTAASTSNKHQNKHHNSHSSSSSSSSAHSPSDPFNPSSPHHTVIIRAPDKNNNNNNNNTTGNQPRTNTVVILVSSIITSSISSILLSGLSIKLNPLPTATLPAIEFISLAITTRIPILIRPIQSYLLKTHQPTKSNQNNNSPYTTNPTTTTTTTTTTTQTTTTTTTSPFSFASTPPPSNQLNHPLHHLNHPHRHRLNPFNCIPRFTKWRLLIKFTLPIALLNLITSWSKAHIAAQLSCSTWQAFEIYSLPLALIVLNQIPSISQPNPELLPVLSIITFTISLLIFNQPVYPSVFILALLSATSQALYLIHLKTWLLSFPLLNPSHPLACSSPFSLLFVLLPTVFNLLLYYIYPPEEPLTLLPSFDPLTALSILSYAFFRLSDRLFELWALHQFQSPLSVLLLIPLRNLVSIIFSQFSYFYIGALGSYLSFLVYAFSIWAIYLVQFDTLIPFHPINKYFSLSSTNGSSSILNHFFKKQKHSPHHDHLHHQKLYQTRQHHDQRRRSSTGGLITYQDNNHSETIQTKSFHDDPTANHHSSRQKKYRHHHLSLGGGGHSASAQHQIEDPCGKKSDQVVHSQKPFPDGQVGHGPTRMKQHWQTFFQVLTFGTLPIMTILKLVLRSQAGLPMTEVAIGMVRPAGSVDLVFSYYNEPLDKFSSVVQYVRASPALGAQNPRVIVYVKHPNASLSTVGMIVDADEVIRLQNVGREGDTYLTHILRHYNSSLRDINPVSTAHNPMTALTPTTTGGTTRGTINKEEDTIDPHFLEQDNLLGVERVSMNSPIIYGLADHTVFMQPDISWHWIAKPRMDLFNPKSTGFLSFGPYLVCTCGKDGLGNGNYERMRDIYTMFHDTFCPPTGQLASYAGQFVVSKQRILMNAYLKYKNMRELLQAPADHWIHREGQWLKWKGATDQDQGVNPVGPVAPFLGHALERSWPAIFHCDDPVLAKACNDTMMDPKLCQCLDPPGP